MSKILDTVTAFIREWRWAVIGLVVLALLAGTWWFGSALADGGSAAGIGIFSSFLGLALIPAGVAVLFISLRLRDRIGGIDWPTMRTNIETDRLAGSIYSAAWVLAVALIVSSVLR